MGSKVNVPALLSIIAVLFFSVSAAPANNDEQFHSSLNNFSHKLFSEIFLSKGEESLIFSPFSIQTSLAMVRLAAGGETAIEMDQGLSFVGQSAESVADNYHSMLSKYENSDILKVANKVYVMKGYELQDKYNEVLSKKFFSPAENIDFSQQTSAAAAINTWVESKTDNAIKNLVTPSLLSSNTRLFLLSAINFKGTWKTPFDVARTVVQDFYTDEHNAIKVNMMYKKTEGFSYFKELDASAVLMPYENSDLSMMVILPKQRNGLAAMVEKLKTVELKSLARDIRPMDVDVRMPKFQAEFEIELTDTLKKLGMNKMFTDADFSNMLKSPETLNVATVIHKAYIDVNEEGTVAAAVTGLEAITKAGSLDFIADHPFYYVILNEDSVPWFQGTFNGV